MSTTEAGAPNQETEAAEALEALRKENDQLRTALASRIVIEQAKGMLAQRFDIHVDDAFERLRREARNRRLRLHALSAAVVAREASAEMVFRDRETSPESGATQLDRVRPIVLDGIPALTQPAASPSTRQIAKGAQ
jgi:hypothetical protein